MQIVAFQGLGQRDWTALYRVPEIQEAIHWGQEVLNSYNIQVEGRPLDLTKACEENGLVLQEHSQTCWQQPCIFLASMAYWKMWRQQNPNINDLLLLGFSFGEWSAATVAGCLEEKESLLVTTMRGIFTSQQGGSSLLVTTRENRLPIKRIRLRCKQVGNVWLANINSPVQGLVSGEESKLPEIQEVLTEHYPWLVIRPLDVGGAFHTPFMKKAREQLAQWMEQEGIRFQKPRLPIVLNATRETTKDPQRIQQMLLRQIPARLNFKKLAEELARDCTLYELCLGRSIIGPLVQQTWNLQQGAGAVQLAALPFPA